MNRSIAVPLISFLASAAPAAPEAAPPEAEVGRAIRATYDKPLERLEVSAVPESDDLFVAVCDWQDHWWGEFVCVKFEGGRVAWKAAHADPDDSPGEQSLLAARAFRDPGFDGPLIEVFGQTHMGNGNIYLYELRGQTLHLLLKTWAVDCHEGGDGRTIRGGALSAEYRDVNGDGRTDVCLTGTIDVEFDAEGDDGMPRPARSIEHRAVFVWDEESGRFVEPPAEAARPGGG